MATKDQGEHTFNSDLLISGEEIRGYTAGEDLSRGEPVAVTGDYEVTSASAGGAFIGIVLYDVSEGEEVALAGDDCEVRVELSAALTAGDAITPDGTGAFNHAADGEDVGILNAGGNDGEWVEAYLYRSAGEVSA